jgi:cytochrome b subunit of formate dehydrogenase
MIVVIELMIITPSNKYLAINIYNKEDVPWRMYSHEV